MLRVSPPPVTTSHTFADVAPAPSLMSEPEIVAELPTTSAVSVFTSSASVPSSAPLRTRTTTMPLPPAPPCFK